MEYNKFINNSSCRPEDASNKNETLAKTDKLICY